MKKHRRRSLQLEPTEIGAAIAWYREDQWERLREISADRDQLDDTYAEWVIKAEEVMKHLAAQGLSIEKVEIDLEDLQRWCEAQRMPVDSRARASYAAEKARERDSGRE
ncbi:MAG TPA: hypothetical protein VMT24_02275 [Aggregatilineaceae bacterium]|jgi:hypothetical protein|nr:hypothetical protein [Aggregatilineaceae bacterium]